MAAPVYHPRKAARKIDSKIGMTDEQRRESLCRVVEELGTQGGARAREATSASP